MTVFVLRAFSPVSWSVRSLADTGGGFDKTLLCAQGNHIFTSGATGTNAAVIRGALRAEKPELLTVVLPQSLHKQPPESQELLQEVCSSDSC